jgi:hypothetical protein
MMTMSPTRSPIAFCMFTPLLIRLSFRLSLIRLSYELLDSGCSITVTPDTPPST